MSYLPVELHCHTIHSDGDFTPESLQRAAVENGLSLIALTDHNTFSGTKELNAPPQAAGHQICNAASGGVLTLAAFAKCSCKHGTWLIARGNKEDSKS